MGEEIVDHALENAHRRIHELVDGCADDQDDRVGPRDRARVGGQLQAAGGQQPLEQFLRALLQERDVARLDLSDLRGVDVVDANLVAAVGKRQRQRQPDVAAAADDDQV